MVTDNVPKEANDPELSEIFDESHVLGDLAAANREEVIQEMVAFVASKGMVTDERWLATALKERERMVPTAMPNGVAFLHARHRAADKFPRQFLTVARSRKGVAFGSPDGKPTYLFFLLALRRDQAHLRWLARLSWICRRKSTVVSLLSAETGEDLARSLSLAIEELPPNLRVRL